MRTVKSICPYCGCGCRLDYISEGKKLVKVLPDNTDEASEGKPCVKGLMVHEVIDKGRILKPMIRTRKKKDFEKVSWQKAYEFIYKKTKDLAPDEIFFAPSGKITNEDDYVIQKFARIAYKTNNIDGCCSRLCHIATVRALENTFGNSAIPTRMDEIYTRDCLLIFGTNPASNYPVIFNRMLKAKQKGMKIVSIGVIESETSQHADVSLLIQPGTEVALLNGMINSLIQTKSYEKKVEEIEEFDTLKRIAEEYDEKMVCDLCGIRTEDFEEAVELIARSKSFGVMHGMGLTQHANAVDNVHSFLNLMILKNGKILSNRGEVNVQGVGDMGCMPDLLPSGPLISFEKLEGEWGVKLPKEKGLNIIEAILISPVKAAFISGFNPAQSLPDTNRVHENLKKIFLVQHDSYLNLTSKFADVILPTPTLIERSGTITNGERRIRLVRKAIEPLGESKPEWKIFKEFSELFDVKKYFDYKNEKEIFEEIAFVIPAYSDVDVDRVYDGHDGWADKEIRFVKFNPEEFKGAEDIRSEKYPFILTTFRSKYQFLSGEMTGKSPTLNKSSDGPFCFLNEDDAKRLKVKDGDRIRITSHVGSLETKARIDKKIPKGIVGMHFHFKELLVNKIFPAQFDEKSFTPNYKMIAVNVKKI